MGLTQNQAKKILKYIESLRKLAGVETKPDDAYLDEAMNELERATGNTKP